MYDIIKNGRKVGTVGSLQEAYRVADAWQEFYPDSRVKIKGVTNG